jgi:LPXTG-motif cell wall-anchored protein
MTQPPFQPQPYLITKPGGMTGTEHAVHILICFFTCGLWIPGYIIMAARAPVQRVEVVVPYGADPAQVAQLRAQAEQTSRALPQTGQVTTTKGTVVGALIIVVAVVAWILYLAWWGGR